MKRPMMQLAEPHLAGPTAIDELGLNETRRNKCTRAEWL
jgi:hypothetical protein